MAPSPRWRERFAVEAEHLTAALGGTARSIEHIGSTAVPGLPAKDTLDILVVVASLDDLLDRRPRVEALGYQQRPIQTFVDRHDHLFFRKVAGGHRTHHLHVVEAGSPEIDDYRRFRDALRADPQLRDEYAALKRDLADRFADDRTEYVTRKALWVDAVVVRLRTEHRAEP